MNAAEFEAFSRGKTVTYQSDGLTYGREEYREDRQVIWQAVAGECAYGHWYGDATGAICFEYDGGTGPVCWIFERADGVVTARSVAAPDAVPLIAAERSDQPLTCPAPDLGV